VIAIAVADRADEGYTIGHCGELGEELADFHAGHDGFDRVVFAADFGGGVGLEVPHVDVGRAARQKDVDDRLVRALALRRLNAEHIGQRQTAEGHAADLQKVTA